MNLVLSVVFPSLSLYSSSLSSGTFAHFFGSGSAAERFISEPSLLDQLVSGSESMPENKVRFSTGGNAALMSNHLAGLGCTVTLGGPIGSKLKELLHGKVVPVSSSNGDKDEVHLILEYSKGFSWRNISSPRANRFIVCRVIIVHHPPPPSAASSSSSLCSCC